ncbi:hypothetical protein [Phenylobacterium sp.]|uniref:hypothetical protein n=1 Tax=Phenylobacterium sp. TaxID=1871053 RepID=UPI002B5BBF2D|nr:hypothetical protein [Phenylobacterium sp.]HVI33395.1 hypothetical protein [Phenylobacterium sp.]
MRRVLHALGLCLVLAACGREAAAPEPVAAAPEPAPAAGPAPTTAVTADVAQPAAYVGRWAATPALCAEGAWMFEPGRVATAGEVSCDFTTVTPQAAGYQVGAKCLAEGTAEPQTFQLALAGAGAAQRMTVTGGPWSGPITLMRCPDVTRSSGG